MRTGRAFAAKVNNTTGSGGGAREITAVTAEIGAVGKEDNSIVSSLSGEMHTELCF